jgi:hypothetical protein
MTFEHDFTRPNQPDDPGVEYVKIVEHTRFAFWGFIAIAVLSVVGLAYVWTDSYPVLKKTDRVAACVQEIR